MVQQLQQDGHLDDDLRFPLSWGLDRTLHSAFEITEEYLKQRIAARKGRSFAKSSHTYTHTSSHHDLHGR